MSTREELQFLAKQGDPEALFRLGLDYLQEAKNTQNLGVLSSAAHLYGQAAKKGHIEAMRRLAELHTMSRDIFCDADPRIALDLYEKIVQENPNDYEAKIALGEMYCTAGFVSRREGFLLPDGSNMERNLPKGHKLIEVDVMQNISFDDLDYFNISRLSDIYGGGWLRDDREPTIDDTIQAIKLTNKAIELAFIENQRKEVIELEKQALENREEQLKSKLKAIKSAQELITSVESLNTPSLDDFINNIDAFVKIPANENFDEDSVLNRLRTHGFAEIADQLKQEWNDEREKNEQRKKLTKEFKKIREQSPNYHGWFSNDVREIGAVGLKLDGTVVTVTEKYDTSNWRDIVAVSAGGSHIVGLRTDGTVIAVGRHEPELYDTLRGWRDIVAISTGYSHTYGLKKDGTVVAVSGDEEEPCNVGDWHNIIAISVNYGDSIVGLKADGTVAAAGNNEYGQCEVYGWQNIIAISNGGDHTVGLKADGTVIAAGNNEYGQCETSNWYGIVMVSSGWYHTVGLKADGTVIAVGDNEEGFCDKINNWHDDIVAINAERGLVGLKSDGTIITPEYHEDWPPTHWSNIGQAGLVDPAKVLLRAQEDDLIRMRKEEENRAREHEAEQRKLAEQHQAEPSMQEEQRHITQSNYWAQHGLCRYCGCKIGLFKKCTSKACGRKN